MNAFFTVFATVVSGTLVFVLGKIAERFFIKPIAAQRKTISEIDDAILYFMDKYSNPSVVALDDLHIVRTTFRHQACALNAQTRAIPWYPCWQRLGWLLTRANIRKAHSALIRLSNTVYKQEDEGRRIDTVEEIHSALQLIQGSQNEEETMNRKQKIAIWIGALLVCVQLVIPPWNLTCDGEKTIPIEYGFLFAPPGTHTTCSVEIDYERLVLLILATALLTAMTALVLRARQMGPR